MVKAMNNEKAVCSDDTPSVAAPYLHPAVLDLG